MLAKAVTFRRSHSEGLCKKGVLKNSVKLAGKHLRRSLLFSDVEVLRIGVEHFQWLFLNLFCGICCHTLESLGIGKNDTFVLWACWIQGIYVYKELISRADDQAYFGIPKNIDLDGMKPDGDLCQTTKQFKREPDPDCRPMHKTFYLQVNL